MSYSFSIIATYLCATLGGLLFGYGTAIVNGGLIQMSEHFDFTLESWVSGLIVSIGVLASFVGASFSGYLSDSYGRKKCILLSSVSFVVSSILAASAHSLYVVYAARVLFGLCIGCISVVVPVYISEISPAKARGRMITVNNIALTGGQVFASIIAFAFIHLPSSMGWRLMFGLGALPAVLQLCLLVKLPESSTWLERIKARHLVSSLKEVQIVSTESNKEVDSSQRASLLQNMMRDADLRKRIIVACGLHFFQQLGGINALMYYSAMVLKDIGFSSSKAAVALSVPLALTNAVFTCVGLLTIDRYGRRATCLVSLTGCFLSLSVVVGLTLVPEGLLSVKTQGVAFFASLTCYLMFFAPGMGPIPWLIASEIFPNQYRSSGMALAAMTNWLSNAIISQAFPMLVGSMGIGWAFFFIDGFLLLAIIFVYCLLPETKGKTLEEIGASKVTEL